MTIDNKDYVGSLFLYGSDIYMIIGYDPDYSYHNDPKKEAVPMFKLVVLNTEQKPFIYQASLLMSSHYKWLTGPRCE